MTAKTFVDTNVLLYAYDREAGSKHQRAKSDLQALWESGQGVVSSQVLSEFYVNVTRKIRHPLPKKEAQELIGHYHAWETVVMNGRMVTEAAQMEDRLKVNFWDALIIVSAQRCGASFLLSEDFQSGRKFGPVTVLNPF